MLEQSQDAVLLLNVEPDRDLPAIEGAVEKLGRQGFVIALTPFDSPALRECADLLLPIGTFAETSGSYVNVAGTWQSFSGVANPVAQARPAWKVLRVLGNLVYPTSFEYVSSEQIRDELQGTLGDLKPEPQTAAPSAFASTDPADAAEAFIHVPLYGVDSVVRRAHALQRTPAARRAAEGDPA
jgi:NADH-quinone oxidoreductase subunit G